MVWSVESLVPKRLTLPVHRMTLQLTIPEHGYAASVRPHFLETRRVAYPGGASDVRYVGYHIVVDGPGIVEMLVASFEEPPPLPPNAAVSPATLTLTMPAPGLPSPIVINAILDPVAAQVPKAAPGWFPQWFLPTAQAGDARGVRTPF